MASLADLHRAVQATLATKRVGTPVFARLLIQGQEKAEAIPAQLARAAGMVKEWMGQPLNRVLATGSAADGQVSLTLQFRDGAAALIGCAHTPPRGDGFDLLLLGNHGAVYHDAGSASLWDETAALPAGAPDAELLAAVEEALRSGKPVEVKP